MNLWMNQSACAGYVIYENTTKSDPWPWFGHQFLLHGSTALQQRLPCHPVQPGAVAWDRSVLQTHTVSQTTFIPQFLCSERCKYVYLIAHINISMFAEQQGDKVHTALLCCQVEGADALTGHCVTLRPIFQQRCPNLQLILLSCNVKRRVAILQRMRKKQNAKIQ